MLTGLGLSVFSGIFLSTVRLICYLLIANLINPAVTPASAPLFPLQAMEASAMCLLLGAGKGGGWRSFVTQLIFKQINMRVQCCSSVFGVPSACEKLLLQKDKTPLSEALVVARFGLVLSKEC